ncbi:MAG: DNA repair protein RecN [Prevotellaceae bacterium]|jgi:DNA repair protein RecN (Recombination protein N)|nr:DNA repair protein RecN [Prevotellaceae bacterium]
MIKSINIENYAIINSLKIDFDKGLSIITGETGAGKSILLGALSLALGQRAETNILKNPEKNCIIEVVFQLDENRFKTIFENSDAEFDTTSVFRRIIGSNGKSRAFINDIPVNVSQLKIIGEQLVDIHSQHQNLLLSNPAFQMEIIDTTAKNREILQTYQSAFSLYKDVEKQLSELKNHAEQAKNEYNYLSFQNEQFVSAKLQADEQEDLENELNQITHAEEIKTVYTNVMAALNNDEASVNTILRENISALKKIENLSKHAENFTSRIESCRIELRDIADEIDRQNESINFDSERQQFIENRLNTIYDLQQKHRVATISELISIHSDIQQKLSVIENFDNSLEKLEKEKTKRFDIMKSCADNLTLSRKQVINGIEKYVVQMLQSLGIPNAVLNINIIENETFAPSGKDNVTFLFSANKEIAPQEISRVASGGEISRLMLSLKSLVIENGMFPTIIFDEIDTGISGDVADKTGEIINSLAKNSQIINITHLPQIASKGNNHYFVYKEESIDTTNTNIRLLTPEERIMEIAKMLSGSDITKAAIDNAKELLKNNKIKNK